MKIPFFFLNEREEAALKVLWSTSKALSASEIAEGIPNREWPVASIQGILRSLEKKSAVKVTSITKLGKSYGRLFRPTLSANEYITMQFNRYYQTDKQSNAFLLSLLGDTLDKKEENLKALQNLLDKHRLDKHKEN